MNVALEKKKAEAELFRVQMAKADMEVRILTIQEELEKKTAELVISDKKIEELRAKIAEFDQMKEIK